MSSDDQLRNEWIQMAGPWLEQCRNGPNAHRAGLLDPVVLEACGDVSGMTVLDSGCGEGRFCRFLAASGAKRIVGVDTCEPLLDAAREAKGDRETYILADAQNLSFLGDATFDLAVSYLNQCDLPRWEDNTREIQRLLVEGGRFVVANLHPMRTAVGGWHRDRAGHKAHVILDNYFEESARNWRMLGVALTNFHRTLSTYLQGYLQAGFSLESFIEPRVTAENVQNFPELADELRVPNFIVLVLRKCQARPISSYSETGVTA